MADLLGPTKRGTRWNESQFQAPPSTVVAYKQVNGAWVRADAKAGVTLFGLCGVNALAMAESGLTHSYVNTMTMFARMAPKKLADCEGRTTLGAIQSQAVADGFETTYMLGWRDAGYAAKDWQAFALKHLAAGAVIVVETLRGQVLHDYMSGKNEDATGLQRHLYCLHDYNPGGTTATFSNKTVPAGFVVSDGCNFYVNPVVNGKITRRIEWGYFSYYTQANVAAAGIGGMLAIYPKPKPIAASPAPAPVQPQPPVVTTTATTQTLTFTFTRDELAALQSLLARLPRP